MRYKIRSAEIAQTSVGKEYKRATITGEDGGTHDVSVWPDFPEYDGVAEDSEVLGKLRIKGKYKNLVSEESRDFAPKSEIQKAMSDKRKSIQQFTTRKELSMRHFAALREAGNFILAGWTQMNEEERKKFWDEYWRIYQLIYKQLQGLE